MRRRRMRVSSTCFYMAVLSITDTLVLWTGCLNQWFYIMKLPTLVIQSTFSCKILTFLFVTFADFSASQTCTVKRAKLVLIGILLFFSFVDGHFLFTLTIVNQRRTSVCMPKPWAVYFVENVFVYIDALKYSALPFIILIVLSFLIITKVFRAEGISAELQNLKQLNHSSNAKPSIVSSASRVGRRVTFMLLSVSIAFCVFSAPMSLMQIVQSFYSDRKTSHSNAVHRYLAIGKSVAEISQYINHSINFFLYAITGRVFRLEFIRLFFPNRHYSANSKRCSIYSFDNRSIRVRPIRRNGLPSTATVVAQKHLHFSSTIPSINEETNNGNRQLLVGKNKKYSLFQKVNNASPKSRRSYVVSQL
ncbi:unnamed protein product [Didymodactylos carnosus]|nr:unnamed protein product [Didymodactylos carnosus]CAF3831560.1 unnamed protein product [Didymodactylos carnosus]